MFGWLSALAALARGPCRPHPSRLHPTSTRFDSDRASGRSLSYRAGHAFTGAVERFDLERRRRVLVRGAIERPREVLGIREVDFDDETLTRGVEMQALNRRERCRVEQS